MRVNTRDSYIDIKTSPDDWHESSTADVAAAYWLGSPDSVFSAIPLDQFVHADYRWHGAIDFPLPEDVRELGQLASVGHEVFFVGLFSQHAGRLKNLPIARFGNIARPPFEPVHVERSDGSIENVEGWLVEARSWGGHSGSPVFWCYPTARVHMLPVPQQSGNRQARRHPVQPEQKIPVSFPQSVIALLGLVSAHFDISQQARTEGDILGSVFTNVNAGIAVVTPAHEIAALIKSDEVQEERESYQNEGKGHPAASYDFAALEEGGSTAPS